MPSWSLWHLDELETCIYWPSRSLELRKPPWSGGSHLGPLELASTWVTWRPGFTRNCGEPGAEEAVCGHVIHIRLLEPGTLEGAGGLCSRCPKETWNRGSHLGPLVLVDVWVGFEERRAGGAAGTA